MLSVLEGNRIEPELVIDILNSFERVKWSVQDIEISSGVEHFGKLKSTQIESQILSLCLCSVLIPSHHISKGYGELSIL